LTLDTGWLDVQIGDNHHRSGSEFEWHYEENVVGEDASYATAQTTTHLGVAEYSDYVIGRSIAATILPDDAVPVGISARVKISATDATTFYDSVVSLRLSTGAVGTTNKARASSTKWPAADTWITYGDAADLWGETGLTKAVVNHPNFGLVISCGLVGDDVSHTPRIDAIQIKVHYTSVSVPGGGSSPTPDPSPDIPAGALHLSIGTYKYGYSEFNNLTGTEGDLQFDEDIIPAVVVTAGNQDKVVLSGFAAGTYPLQANYLKIYRTLVNGSLYFYIGYLARTGATWAFPNTFTDQFPDTEVALSSQSPVTGHDMPPQGVTLYEYNDRLFGFASQGEYTAPTLYPASWSSVDGRDKLWFSSLNQPEYWPQQVIDPTNVLSYPQYSGGYIAFGSKGASIVSLRAEGSTGELQNQRGSSLLVLKESDSTYRLFGYDWSDFQKQTAVDADCVSDCAVNTGAGVAWVSRLVGPVLLPYGSGSIINLYDKLFPATSGPFSDYINPDYISDVTMAVWHDWLLLSCPKSGGTGNDHTFACYLPTRAWYQIGSDTNLCGASAFSVWIGPGDAGELYMSDVAEAKLWRLWTPDGASTFWDDDAATGVPWKWQSGMLLPGGDEANTVKETTVKEIAALVRTPTADQTIYMQIYSNGAAMATWSEGKTADSTKTDPWQWLRWYSPADNAPWGFQLGMSGVASTPLYLEELRIAPWEQGRAR